MNSKETAAVVDNGLMMGYDSPGDFANPANRVASVVNGHNGHNGHGNGNGNGHGHGKVIRPILTPELTKALLEVKGQSQFLLYLADQIEESLGQLAVEDEETQAAFLCKILAMYASQLESKHRGVGETIAQTCGQVYSTVRDVESR